MQQFDFNPEDRSAHDRTAGGGDNRNHQIPAPQVPSLASALFRAQPSLPPNAADQSWSQLRDAALVTMQSQPDFAWRTARDVIPALIRLEALDAAKLVATEALKFTEQHWDVATVERAIAIDTYAFVLLAAGEFFEARTTYQKAAESANAAGTLAAQIIQSQSLQNAGLAAWQEDDFETAYDCFLSAHYTLSDPVDADLHDSISYNLQQARAAWGQELLAEGFDAHTTGDDSEAIRHYHQALEVLEPGGPELVQLVQKARINLGTLHLNAGDVDLAESEVYKALSLDGQNEFSILGRVVLMSIFLEQEAVQSALPLVTQTLALRASTECHAFDEQLATLLLRWSRASLRSDEGRELTRSLLKSVQEIVTATDPTYEMHRLEIAAVKAQLAYHEGDLDQSTKLTRRAAQLFEQSSLRETPSHGLTLVNLGIHQFERAQRMNELRLEVRTGESEYYTKEAIDALFEEHHLREGLFDFEHSIEEFGNVSADYLDRTLARLVLEIAQESERSLHQGRSILENHTDQTHNLGNVHEYLSVLYQWLIDVVPEPPAKSRLRALTKQHRKEAIKIREMASETDTDKDGN